MQGPTPPDLVNGQFQGAENSPVGQTVFDAFERALAHSPDKVLVVAGEKRWTYRDVALKVEALAVRLADMGLRAGDVVSIQLPNWAEFIVIHLAATRLGAITNCLLPIYRAKELGYILSFAQTKIVFAPGEFRKFDYRPLYRKLRPDLPALEHIVIVGGGCPDDMIDFDSLLEPTKESPPRCAVDADDTTMLIFTSGTESNPKGVIHTHATMNFGNRIVASILGLNSDEVIWAASPIGHATGMMWTVRQAIILGATVVMQEVWDAAAAVDLIERERCTFTTAATPFAAVLAEEPGIEHRDLSSFRIFMCGGATVPSMLGAALRQKIGVNLLPVWGMSECFVATICSPNDPEDLRYGTDGRALPGVEMAIFDSTRTRILAPGQEGEIATRGPHVCKGYFKDPERTAATFSSDGWLFSGDLGVIDEGGYLRVLGRIKDIINRGGLKISAGEVEDMLLQHPKVRAAAVVGIPDNRLGEKACACIIPHQGENVSLGELIAMLKARGVAAYKLPEFIAIIENLPMTATGKVQKFKLRDDLVAGTLQMSST